MAWTMERLAVLIMMIILIILLIFFVYTYLGSESGSVGAVDTLWGGIIPSS